MAGDARSTREPSLTVRRRRLAEAREAAESCRRCELWKKAEQTVFGDGDVRSVLMLVGEQPGDEED
ncbi:MAG: hypothetical protein QM736_01395 [Vicinamibacterales bacterium]